MTANRITMPFATLCVIGAALAVLAAARALAQEEAPPPPPQPPEISVPPELKKVLDGLDAANSKVKSVKANVVYRRDIPLLDESQTSEGSLVFKKPDLLRLRLGKPRNEEVCSNGKRWWVVSHNDKQVEIYDVAGEGSAAAEASFLTFGYGESSARLLEQYEITLASQKEEERPAKEDRAVAVTCYRLEFVPRDEEAPARFAKIEVELTDDLWLPRGMVLHESDGEIVHTFQMRDMELNPDLKEETFTYEPPRGYTVLKPQE